MVIVALAGVALGMYLARRKSNTGFIEKQMEQKTENLSLQTPQARYSAGRVSEQVFPFHQQ